MNTKTNTKLNVRKLVFMGILVAMSVALVAIVHFPIFPQAAFLEYDPADIPILIGTFAFGPLAGLALTVVASVIQGLTVSAQSGLYGILMHIIATGTYVLVAGFIYKAKKTRIGALIAIISGALAMAAVMAVANLIITPIFMGAPVDAVKAMLWPVIIPFNLIKAGINGALTFVLYKPLSNFINKETKKPAKNANTDAAI